MAEEHNGRMEELRTLLADRDGIRQRLTAAKEDLDRETYHLDTIELAIELTQSELDKLQSLSVTSLFSSLAGTKAAKIDARREDLEAIQCEQRECEETIQNLARTVEQLQGELAGFAHVEAEFQTLCAAQTPDPGSAGHRPSAHDLRRALDAGKSLLNGLSGAFKLCSRLRSGPRVLAPRGVLFSAAARMWGNKTAGGVTGQVAGSVRHLLNQLAKLDLGTDYLPDVAAMLPQLELFADASSLSPDAGVDPWADLEALTKSVIADIEAELSRAEA